MRWQIFERSWRLDWFFVGFVIAAAASSGAVAVARRKLATALDQGERCLALADIACVTVAVERARALAPDHPRTRLLALGSRLHRGERDQVEAILRYSESETADARTQAARVLLLGDTEAAQGRPSRAREHYRAALSMGSDEALVSERMMRLDRAEREGREQRAAESQRWRASFDRLVDAVEQGQQELISARTGEIQQRLWEIRDESQRRPLQLVLATIGQAASRQREAQRLREFVPPQLDTFTSSSRPGSEERRQAEARSALERRQTQLAAIARAVNETLTQAREQLDQALARIEAPPKEAP